MSAVATATKVRFHVGLHTSDLGRAVEFYRIFFGVAPAKHYDDYARFEVERPPLVLALYPSPQEAGGALNHIGLRMPDSESLVEVQRRLEEHGITTQRQEGVECCYARQTKFWVTDADRVLWEVYTLHEDIEHSGFDDPPTQAAPSPRTVWEHRLTEPFPESIPHDDDSLDEVRLEGSFNASAHGRTERLLTEAFRTLRPGGSVAIHGLVGDRPFPGEPKLPGLASMVRYVPTQSEPLDALKRAGFARLYYEKLGDIHCFQVNGVELREMRLVGWKPAAGCDRAAVVYKGPFEQVTDEDGNVYCRGERVVVTRGRAESLRRGPAADQFTILEG